MLNNQEKQELREYQTKLILIENRKSHGHLSLNERDKITILFAQGLSLRKIAKAIDRSPSTISRELHRNEAVFYRGNYVGSQTHSNVKRKWISTHQRKKINNNQIKNYIHLCLKSGLSPQLIAGRLKFKYDINIHHETIYQYIYKEKNILTQFLLRRKFGRISRKSLRKPKTGTGKNIPNRVDIDLRSLEANLRSEIGHFECDSIESSKKRGEQRSCLTVIVDRASRKTTIKKTASKTSEQTAKSVLKALKPYKNTVKSITYDNGCEFTKHEKINKKFKKQGLKSYFCKPYHSWEKGTVENINGLIRRFFPKGTNFDNIKHKEIKAVENWINNRPMKILGFKTPNEKFYELKQIS